MAGSPVRYGCAALLTVLIPAAGQSQSPPSPMVPAPTASAPALSPEARAAVEARIGKLHKELGITDAQMPLWSAFAEAMRENVASTDALFARRAGAVAGMSAAENMHSYAEIARAYADDTERLATAFDRLYVSLSPAQQHAADALFRQQAVVATRPPSRH